MSSAGKQPSFPHRRSRISSRLGKGGFGSGPPLIPVNYQVLLGVVALMDWTETTPGNSYVQAFRLDGQTSYGSVLGLLNEEACAITAGDSYFYLQTRSNVAASTLFGPSLVPLETAQQWNGTYTPTFGPVAYLPGLAYGADALYMCGQYQGQQGVLCFNAATGAPMGAAAGNPILLTNVGHIDVAYIAVYNNFQGYVVLIVCDDESLYAVVLQQGGNPPASLTPIGPYPFTSITNMPADGILWSPAQGPDGNLYFCYGGIRSYHSGICSFNPGQLINAIGSGASLSMTQFQTQLLPDSAESNGEGYAGFCTGGTAQQPFVYILSEFSQNTTPYWNVYQGTGGTQFSQILSNQPGIPQGLCLYKMPNPYPIY